MQRLFCDASRRDRLLRHRPTRRHYNSSRNLTERTCRHLEAMRLLHCIVKKVRRIVAEFWRLPEAEIPRLRRYARALCRDAAAADDLVQDCLCRALRKSHLFQPGSDLRAWLFTMLHNQHANGIRRSIRQGVPVPIDEVETALDQPPTQSDALTLRDLDRAMGQIAEEQRQLLLMVGLEGMSLRRSRPFSIFPLGRCARASRVAAIDCVNPSIGATQGFGLAVYEMASRRSLKIHCEGGCVQCRQYVARNAERRSVCKRRRLAWRSAMALHSAISASRSAAPSGPARRVSAPRIAQP
jgi:RNA polymerase sigma-70 factor, ECF subfamily